MSEVLTQDGGKLLGWRFKDAAGRVFPLLPEQVYHPKFFNPYHPVRGLGEYQAAAVAAMTDVAAGAFVRNLMASNGNRGPIISAKKGQTITDPQMTQIRRSLLEKARQAEAGNIISAFLPAEVEVSDPQVQKPDSDFVAQRIESRKEIYLIFGVPASLAEPKAHYSIGAASDRYILIEDTCKPLAAKLAFTIGLISQRILGLRGMGLDHLIATLDFEQHSVMLQARTERIKSWNDLRAGGMSAAAAGEYLAMRLPPFPGDDVGFLPINVQTVADALAAPPKEAAPAVPPEADDDPPEDDDDDTGKTLLSLLSRCAPEPLTALLALPGVLDGPAHVERSNPNHDGSNGQFAHANSAKTGEINKARKTGLTVNKDVQRYTEEKNEPEVAKLLGARHIPGNGPVDLEFTGANGKPQGIELKTMVDNKASKLRMKADALAKKAKWARDNKGEVHTLVCDDRKVYNAHGPGQHGDTADRVYYYRRGAGNFRVANMHRTTDINEVRQLMDTPNRKLPKAAQKELDWIHLCVEPATRDQH